jgi:multidrug efflux pump subunit AcrA (membrane-fusion protein)
MVGRPTWWPTIFFGVLDKKVQPQEVFMVKTTTPLKQKIQGVLTIIILGIIASGITATLMLMAKGPERTDGQEYTRSVRVITTQALDVVPRVIGYGYVEPGQAWQAVAEVSGKVVELHPRLKKGGYIKEGEVLLRLDPSKYDLAIAQKEASIESINAQLAELDINEKNLETSLKIEKNTLTLSKKELERQEQLLEKKMIARSVYEKQEQTYNAQLGKVQNLQNALNLIPANRKTLNANLTVNQIALKDAKLDRQNTKIAVPFDCRITEVKIEIAQFVQQGQVVVKADGIKTAEIRAQIPTEKMRNLAKSWDQDFSLADIEYLGERVALKVLVRFNVGDFSTEWDARFVGADAAMDPQARTVGLIVVVDDPYAKVKVGERPPMVRNMFCEVELSGKSIPETVVIPRSALHDGAVYVVNSQNRLEKKSVTLAFSQTNFHAIEGGLNVGELIVVSDLIPAIEGMLLQPIADEDLAATLIAEATGEGEVK